MSAGRPGGGGGSTPFVSVVIPCYDERPFIEDLLRSFMEQDYPEDRYEVLVVDGGSTDGTREVVDEWADRQGRIRRIDNPARRKSPALNRGIERSRGEVLIRADAHADYPRDFIRANVDALDRWEADVVGGVCDTRPRTPTLLGRAIALSGSSRFGFGASTFRSGATEAREVNALFGGCFRRDVFDRVGLFDERLDRGQDRDMFERIRETGGRVVFAPEIRSIYYQRSDMRSFLPWNFVSGMTPFFISRITGSRKWAPRNLVPAAFVLALVLLPLIGVVVPGAWMAWLLMVAVYLTAGITAAILDARRAGDLRLAPLLAFLFPLIHVSYGIGSLWGLVRPLRAGRPWARA